MNHVESGRSNEKHYADETGGDAGGALGHTQPFVKSVLGAESSQLREKVEYRENQGRHRGNKELIVSGDRNRVNSVTLLLFSYLTVVKWNRISSERI